MDMNPESNSIASTLEEPVQLSSGACPLCGMSDTVGICEVETWSTYRIEECRDCGFVFAAPRPTPKALDDFYTSEYFRKTQNGKTGYADYRGMAEKNARRMWHELKVILRRRSIAPGKVLDVGCATGGFLAEAQAEGVNCLGVELSEYAVGVARAEFKLAVHQGDIYSPALEEQGFDLLTMWHVLEHLIEPMSTLKRAHELLAANGTLRISRMALHESAPSWWYASDDHTPTSSKRSHCRNVGVSSDSKAI